MAGLSDPNPTPDPGRLAQPSGGPTDNPAGQPPDVIASLRAKGYDERLFSIAGILEVARVIGVETDLSEVRHPSDLAKLLDSCYGQPTDFVQVGYALRYVAAGLWRSSSPDTSSPDAFNSWSLDALGFAEEFLNPSAASFEAAVAFVDLYLKSPEEQYGDPRFEALWSSFEQNEWNNAWRESVREAAAFSGAVQRTLITANGSNTSGVGLPLSHSVEVVSKGGQHVTTLTCISLGLCTLSDDFTTKSRGAFPPPHLTDVNLERMLDSERADLPVGSELCGEERYPNQSIVQRATVTHALVVLPHVKPGMYPDFFVNLEVGPGSYLIDIVAGNQWCTRSGGLQVHTNGTYQSIKFGIPAGGGAMRAFSTVPSKATQPGAGVAHEIDEEAQASIVIALHSAIPLGLALVHREALRLNRDQTTPELVALLMDYYGCPDALTPLVEQGFLRSDARDSILAVQITKRLKAAFRDRIEDPRDQSQNATFLMNGTPYPQVTAARGCLSDASLTITRGAAVARLSGAPEPLLPDPIKTPSFLVVHPFRVLQDGRAPTPQAFVEALQRYALRGNGGSATAA